MKYKKHIATGALAFSLLISGSNVFAASPQDLGIKNVHQTYQRQNKNNKDEKTRNKKRGNKIVGTISAISGANFTVEIKNLKTKALSSVDVKTGSLTIYRKNGVRATFTNLTVGEKVIVVGNLDQTTNIVTAKMVNIVALSH